MNFNENILSRGNFKEIVEEILKAILRVALLRPACLCLLHYLPQLHGGDNFLPVNIKKCKCLPKTINILGGDLAVQTAAFVGCVTWCGSHPQIFFI